VASLVFFALPFVIRSISQDIDLDRAPTPGFLKGSAIPVGAEAGPTAGKVGGGADTASSPIAEAKQAFSPDPSMGSIPEREVILRRRRIEDSLDELNRSFDEEFKLTAREKEIASYLAERYDYETISDKLLISVNTLKVHVKNIYRKYDLPGRKALVELVESRSEGKSA
jgi:DNA-binding CsgD family transcriptional regulator